MSVNTVSGSSGANSNSTSTPVSQTNMDENTFLQLMVAQMKNQDPDSPTDPSTMLSQTAQFTTVQELTQVATEDQNVYNSSQQQIATSMLGRTVTWTDVSGNAKTGVVTDVSIGASTPNLTVGGVAVSLSTVSSVATAATPAAATPAAATPAATTAATGASTS
jgi:flagellar basal-body rod modification protein FlgD